ncbi:uncharacterized protein BCR38DRAFT_404369 [Pseudomassariella vexata]|uniref:Elongation factor 1-gamma n=1 Tax=Pseudomassariella vexata TaxID=1141098 RepID=A0A1Y2EI56_9PEZI|nr:uncharacterized protein BCR38DRAFT_404369 [Pseudomassariella vexata]ORY71261.1 hypothetical protein BCR38DRAFT_404369 [Pseudomassariella vexata]
MAPFGKIFTKEKNPRTTAILAVAKANGLEIERVEVDTTKPTEEFLKYNPLSRVPTFVGSDGYVLTECMAIAIYIAPHLVNQRFVVTSQNEKTTLLGKTKQDYASILKWMSFFNTEVLPRLGAWYRPLLGWDPYNKKNVDEAQKGAVKAVSIVEEHLLHNTFLVGERITLADLFAVSIISRGFQFFYDKAWRSANPNVSRWYETVYHQAIYQDVAAPFELLDTPALANVAPKKPEQPKKEPKKPAAKKEAKPVDDEEEDEPPKETKAKHPLDLLPRATFPLDEWKRQYSNNSVDDSMKWFWENVNFEEYSIWKIEYKYNSELKLTFQSANLVSGFFTRLEASRKYVFGAASVYGVSGDSVIQGAVILRGQDAIPALDVAPDLDSFDVEKLDPTKPEDKAFVESMWKWDKPIVKEGKEYAHDRGFVYK